MKNIFTIITIILATSFSCLSQYKSVLGDNSTKYLIFETIIDGSEVNEHSSLGIIEDDGYLYHQFQFCLIREDTVSGKVWRRISLSEEEVLIMDMSLNVGDTMHLSQSNFSNLGYAASNQGYALVQNVFYNDYGKNIELNCHTNNPLITYYTPEETIPLKFIEGIGPNYSFYYGSFIFPDNTYLVCSYKDDALVFTNTEFNTCDSTIFWEIGQNSAPLFYKDAEPFYCFPNPNNGTFNILCLNRFSGELEIIDLAGNIIFTKTIINSTSIDLFVPDLRNGIYIVVLKNKLQRKRIRLVKV